MKQILLILLPLLLGCSSSSTWKFSVPPSTLVVTQRVVVQMKRPILYVIHNSDGEWQFFADVRTQLDPVVELSIRDLIAIDSTIIDVAYLKKGWKAWHSIPCPRTTEAVFQMSLKFKMSYSHLPLPSLPVGDHACHSLRAIIDSDDFLVFSACILRFG